MKCVEIRQNKLSVIETEPLKISRGEVLIKVHAIGVNRADIMQRKGSTDLSANFKNIPGIEVTGEIIETKWGSNKNRKGRKKLNKGDRVIAILGGGGYAEFCSAPAEKCIIIPDDMTFEDAAAAGYSFLVAWYNLTNIAKLKRGETILIHGGSSGLATAAIQIARNIGAKVIVTTSNDDKKRLCEKLGANFAINSQYKNFENEVTRITKGEGVDVIIDIIGGDYLEKNIDILKNKGRYLSLANTSNKETSLDLDKVIEKELTLQGSLLANLSDDEMANIIGQFEKKIIPLMKKKGFFARLFGRKSLHPVVLKEFSLYDAQAAHDYIDRGLSFGKVILKII